jgi:hypothetical protein
VPVTSFVKKSGQIGKQLLKADTLELMNRNDISNLRLSSQQVEDPEFKTAKELVSWMCAMQAQDYKMAEWAIGLRLRDATEKSVEYAADEGEIIRTHLLRPTWHYVSCDDIYWLLDLTAPKIIAAMKWRDRELGITESMYSKSNFVIERTLAGGKHLAREEIVAELMRSGIPADNNRASHFLVRAEVEGIICSGKMKAGRVTYALLQERVPKIMTLSRDEALAELAGRYFRSRCPATLQDFTWWSGLNAGEARRAVEMIKSDLVPEIFDNQTYWFPGNFSGRHHGKGGFYFLPAFDEFIISYRDRSASLPPVNHVKAVSSNGIFRPLLVRNGQITGIWKRTVKKDKVIMEAELFDSSGKISEKALMKASASYGDFLERGTDIILINKSLT